MNHSEVYDEASVVLIGNFNPAIFHPSWFARHDLVPDREAEAAELEVCLPQISRFRLSWFSFEATEEKLVLKSSDESHFAPLRDLVVGTFRLLSHTPIKKLGINRQLHFDVLSEKNWHHIGHTLAPKAIWDGLLEAPGLKLLNVEGQRTDGHPGVVHVTVQPVPLVPHRVGVIVNNHFDIDSEVGISAVDLLMETWETSLTESRALASTLIQKALASQGEALEVKT